MKKILTAILFLFIASGLFAKGIDGTWKGKMQGQNGDMELTFVFKIDGEKLSGQVKTENGDVEITNTKVNGKEFSFDVEFNGMSIKHNCILKEDDTISLKVSMGDSEIILKRQ